MAISRVVNLYSLSERKGELKSNLLRGARDERKWRVEGDYHSIMLDGKRDDSDDDRLARVKEKYLTQGMRRTVGAVIMLHTCKCPLIVLLQFGATFLLPGGHYFGAKLCPTYHPHFTKPKECKKVFIVQLSEKQFSTFPTNVQLCVVPMHELYDNVGILLERDGKQIDHNLLKNFSTFFLEIGESEKGSTYCKDFEQVILAAADTSGYFLELASAWFSYDSSVDYWFKIARLKFMMRQTESPLREKPRI